MIGHPALVNEARDLVRPDEQLKWMLNKVRHRAKSVARELGSSEFTTINRFVVRPRTPLRALTSALTWLPVFGRQVDMWFLGMSGLSPLYLGVDGEIYRRFYSEFRGDFCLRAMLERAQTPHELDMIFVALNELAHDYADD